MKTPSFAAVMFCVTVNLLIAQSYSISPVRGPGGNNIPVSMWPMGVAVDGARTLYLVEWGHPSVRKVETGGSDVTLAGSAVPGSADGVGSQARFSVGLSQLAIVVDDAANVFVADVGNHTVRRITPEGAVTTLAGLAGEPGSEDGNAGTARLSYPTGVAVDRRGNVYIADQHNHTIRKITAGGFVTTLAGLAGHRGSDDGVGSTARFYAPANVTVDVHGNVYVGSYDDTVRRISPAGVVTTLAGRAGVPGYANGRGSDARFYFSYGWFDSLPIGMTVDPAGNVFVTDPGNYMVRRITPDGVVTTVGRAGDFSWPMAIAAHGSGELCIADAGVNSRIVRAVPDSTLKIIGPQSQTVAPGSTVVFKTTVSGAPGATYQWFKDGETLIGATDSTLVIAALTNGEAGTYRCVVKDGTGYSAEVLASLSVLSTAAPGRLVNFSVRSHVSAASPALLVGATIAGAGLNNNMPVLLRATGPSLGQFNVTGLLADPQLVVSVGGNVISSNDNWGGNPQVAARMAQVGAFGYSSVVSLDSALAMALASNTYNLRITGNNGATGITLCEIFDASPGPHGAGAPRLSNLSVRNQVGTNGDVLIVGFSIGGTTARTVLLRVAGPSLAALGISGVLADPVLQLFSGSTLIGENNDWGGDVQISRVAAAVRAFDFQGGDSRDSALMATLPPGSYTLQVRGANDEAGVALAEIYDVP